MELNELKSTWNTMITPTVSTLEIQAMLLENKHPVLKGIRKQMIIEVIGWSIFLICYYAMFDGDKKPLWINALLVLSVLLPFIHNLMGYNFAKYLVHGTDIRESLKIYLSKVKRYAIISIITRQVYLTGFLLFFSYSISFNTSKYVLLSVIIFVFLIQLWLLCKIWIKRVKNLGNTIMTFG